MCAMRNECVRTEASICSFACCSCCTNNSQCAAVLCATCSHAGEKRQHPVSVRAPGFGVALTSRSSSRSRVTARSCSCAEQKRKRRRQSLHAACLSPARPPSGWVNECNERMGPTHHQGRPLWETPVRTPGCSASSSSESARPKPARVPSEPQHNAGPLVLNLEGRIRHCVFLNA